jgi:hypothetical protein
MEHKLWGGGEKSVTIKIIPFFQMLEDVGYKLKLNFFGGGGQK